MVQRSIFICTLFALTRATVFITIDAIQSLVIWMLILRARFRIQDSGAESDLQVLSTSALLYDYAHEGVQMKANNVNIQVILHVILLLDLIYIYDRSSQLHATSRNDRQCQRYDDF